MGKPTARGEDGDPAQTRPHMPMQSRETGGTLLPLAERPFILGARGALAVWAAALNVSRSLYS